jgi:DNA-binding transcriptional MocR family regulator
VTGSSKRSANRLRARAAGISAGLRVLLELPPASPSSFEIAERARARSIALFPLPSCYHSGRIPDGAADALVVGYTALPEHDFDRGIASLATLLAEEITSARRQPTTALLSGRATLS